MSAATAHLSRLIQRHNDPQVVQLVRSTAAAVIAYVAAVELLPVKAPLTAPLTALLVVQVTLYTTLTTGIRRVIAVVAGVLIAIGFSELIGLTWWSLGLIILASLVIGHLIRVDEFVAEVAISGMLILGVGAHAHAGQALDRVEETLIGAAVGILLNALLAPPVFVEPAGAAVAELADRLTELIQRVGREVSGGATLENAWSWLHEARRLDNEIARFDESLRRAEESTRLNPRVRQGAMARLILRSGLDTLEICTVVLRTLCRSLADLGRVRSPDQPVYAAELAERLGELLGHIAAAVDSFGHLIAAQVTEGAEQAEADLSLALRAGREDRERIAELLRSETENERWDTWQLHGTLLATIDRLLDELDLERRAEWLADQLATLVDPAGRMFVDRLRSRARTARTRLRFR
jgi:hypothetical protein